MKPLVQVLARILPVMLLAASLAACDSTPSAVEEGLDDTYSVEQLSLALSSELQLSTDQRSTVQEAAARYGPDDAREPGYLWHLAGELNQTLTQEQVRAMLGQSEQIARQMRQQGMAGPFGPHPEGFGTYGFQGRRPGLGELGAGPGFGQGPDGLPLGRVLTEEQFEAVHALRLEFMDEIRALAQAIRTADDREAAVVALEAKLAELQAAIDSWLDENLTEEQKALLEELMQAREARRIANREAVRAAIDAVLGPGMGEALQAIHDAFVAEIEAAREAYAPGSAEFRAAVLAAAEVRDAAIEALLDENQLGIYRIHQALLIRAHNLGGFGPGFQHGMGMGPGGFQNGDGMGPGGFQNGDGMGPGGFQNGDGTQTQQQDGECAQSGTCDQSGDGTQTQTQQQGGSGMPGGSGGGNGMNGG
jgi:hypothetical protein